MKTSFNTLKSSYIDTDTYIKEKFNLYATCTFEEIETLLETNDISISRDEILDLYAIFQDVETTVEYFQTMYDDQLDYLSGNDTMFDDDCVYLYILKTLNLIEK